MDLRSTPYKSLKYVSCSLHILQLVVEMLNFSAFDIWHFDALYDSDNSQDRPIIVKSEICQLPPQILQFVCRKMAFLLLRYRFDSAGCHLLQRLTFLLSEVTVLSFFLMALYCCAIFKTCRCHHPKDITSVAFHRSYPLFASCSEDNTTYVFHGMVYSDLNQDPLIVPLQVLRGHSSLKAKG